MMTALYVCLACNAVVYAYFMIQLVRASRATGVAVNTSEVLLLTIVYMSIGAPLILTSFIMRGIRWFMRTMKAEH